MHPCHWARSDPDRAAYIMADSGETVTFAQLETRSNQTAHALREAGCKPGDTIAIFAENSARYFEICWAAQRAGLYFVCISTRLTAPEVHYILEDSGARLFVASASLGSVAREARHLADINDSWSIDGEIEGFTALETVSYTHLTLPTTPYV